MDNDTFSATVHYHANCDYNESESTKTVSLPLQTPTIDVTYITPNTDSDVIYYGDILTLKAIIKHKDGNNEEQPVQTGEVNFYYIDESDPSKTLQLINYESIKVDQEGGASIKYIPHDNGVIIAKYDGIPFFESVTSDDQHCRVELTERPVTINVVSDSGTQIVNPESTITLTAKVTDDITGDPVKYGLVTFLNYHTHDINNPEDGFEKVIGNPAYIKKIPEYNNSEDENEITGYKYQASIKYSPIQSEDDNQLIRNMELIRAVYNYDNEEYGVKWKYYKMHSDYTAIAIAKPGTINMRPLRIKDGNNIKPINIADGGLYYLDQGESLYCECKVLTNSNSVITDAKVVFSLEGEDYISNIDAALTGDSFIAVFTNIPVGRFYLSAKINNAQIIDQDTEESPNVIATNNNLYKIKSGQFLQSIESEQFYIEVRTKKIDYTMSLDDTKDTLAQINTPFDKNNIIATFDGNFNEKDIAILQNRKCTFWIANLNKTYEGTLNITNRNGTYIITASPDQNITFTSINDFSIYAYMVGGTFSANYNGETIQRQYPTIYSSNIITIKARNNPSLSLNIRTSRSEYPGEITYYVTGENFADKTVDIDVFLDNEKIEDKIQMTSTVEDNKTINKVINKITNISAGSHVLKVKPSNTSFSNLEMSESFSINKNSLIFSATNKRIPTSMATTINFVLKNSDNTIIDSDKIKENQIKVFLRRENDSIMQELTPSFNDIYNTTYKSFDVIARIYDDCEWYIAVGFSGNDCYEANYNPSNISSLQNFEKLIAVSETPYIVKTHDDNFNIQGQVIYDTITAKENNEMVNRNLFFSEQVLVIIELLDDNDPPNSLKFVRITDTNGYFNINKTLDSNTEWQQYSTLKYTIDPKHSILNTFKQSTTNNVVSAFKNYFSSYNKDGVSDNSILNLYDQASNMNFVNLFWGYKKVDEHTVSSWEDE